MCLRVSKGTRLTSEIGKLTTLVDLRLHSVDKSPQIFTQLGNLTQLRILAIWFDEIEESTHKDLVESLSSPRRVQELAIRFES